MLSFCSHRKEHTRLKKSERGKHKADSDSEEKGQESKPKKEKKKKSEKPQGFAWGLKPEWITGDTDSSGELMFLMK